MRLPTRLAGAAAAAAGLLLATPLGSAHAEGLPDAGAHAVFVQTNNLAANSIAVYDRAPNGRLSAAGSYFTGGQGGRQVGSMSDPLASQGSLVLAGGSVLLAVNAGSNTISAFTVRGDRLALSGIAPSGGSFPTSLAVHGNLVYVLNAALPGSVSGFRLEDGRLHPIPGSTRSLGLVPPAPAPPPFLSSPAQVGFTPSGRQLIVTTKTNNTVDVFAVDEDGLLAAQPVKNPESPVPFAFLFSPGDQLDLVNAGSGAVVPLRVNRDGTIAADGSAASDGQVAACWIALARGFAYVSNTGSGTISQFRIESDRVQLVSATAASLPGAIDLAASGRFLYAESGTGTSGSVTAFAIGDGGSLTPIQSFTVPGGASLEGIAAT